MRLNEGVCMERRRNFWGTSKEIQTESIYRKGFELMTWVQFHCNLHTSSPTTIRGSVLGPSTRLYTPHATRERKKHPPQMNDGISMEYQASDLKWKCKNCCEINWEKHNLCQKCRIFGHLYVYIVLITPSWSLSRSQFK